MGSMRGLEEPGLLDPSASSSSDNTHFDASRYEFFGKGAVEEVVLGGLDDENEIDSRFGGPNDAEYRFPSLGNKDEVDMLSSLENIDDLASTFAKLNRTVSGSRNAGVIGDRRSVSMESSSTTDWTAETELHNWVDPQLLDGDSLQDNKRWWSQPDPSFRDSKPLHRTSSYPLHPLTHHHSVEPIPIPKTRSSSSYPYPNQLTRHSSIPSLNSGPHYPASGSSSYAGSQLLLTGYPHGLPFAPNIPYSPSNMYHPNIRDPMQSLLFSQKQMLNQLQMQAPVYPPHLASIMPEIREQRPRPSPRGKHHHHNRHPNSSQNSETNSQRADSMIRLQFRSKYMSAEEIESILKMQHAGTHNNDPYTDDYYHQACIAKRSSGSYNRQRFCPVSIKDSSSKSRSSNSESHGHLQVDSLGRVSFSSIRRPKPLLEPDQPDSGSHGQKFPKPLEKEVPLAARITIEDGFSLLLEVDDIDRLLQSNPPQDGGFQLRRRRQVLLEGLAASLELVDPLSPAKPGNPAGLSPKDDLVFLRLVSLPKGRKLLSRYLQQLIPGSELARLVCMAICRHLRFLFGGLPSDTAAAETITKLVKTVSLAVRHMELSSLSACLAAVVCSSEQPPLRPIGSSAGDGASVIIKSVLERATDLLTNPHTSSICTHQNRAFWQASFDAFFKLLTKYCLGKYESILQMLLLHGSGTAVIGSDMARAIGMEMPAELLCASCPHTNEQQKKMLMEFAQRAMPVTGFRPDGPGSGHATSESVPG
ncbi:protein PAT1 homolog 1-like [Carex rostrata]